MARSDDQQGGGREEGLDPGSREELWAGWQGGKVLRTAVAKAEVGEPLRMEGSDQPSPLPLGQSLEDLGRQCLGRGSLPSL